MTVLRDLDETGASESGGDALWAAVRVEGSRVVLVKRVGPPEAQEWAAGDEYLWCEAITDDPQEPQDMAGYVKHIVPLGPQAWGRGVVGGVVDESSPSD